MHHSKKTIPATVSPVAADRVGNTFKTQHSPFFGKAAMGTLRHIVALWLAAIMLLPASLALAADDEPQKLVENSVTQVLEVLDKHQHKLKTNPGVLDETIEENIVPHLDFLTMTRLSVGKNWKKATTEEQKTLVSEFKIFLINTYRSAISEYGGEAVKFAPFKKSKRDDRAVVESVFGAGSGAVPVQYKLRSREGTWQVYDIVVSDLSLVIQYRSSFTSEIENNGITGLIKLLKDKNNS